MATLTTYRIHLEGETAWPDLEGRQVIAVELFEAAYFPPEDSPDGEPRAPRVAFRFPLPVGHDLLAHLKSEAPVVVARAPLGWLGSVVSSCRGRQQLERYHRWLGDQDPQGG